jgi:hypothetical protein
MNNFIKPVAHMPKPVSIERQENDVIVIEGVRYAAEFFRTMSWPDTKLLYALRRDGDLVWLTEIHDADEAKKFFESQPQPPAPLSPNTVTFPQIGEERPDLGEEGQDQEQGDNDGL